MFVSALAARILPQTLAQKFVQLRMDSRSHFNASWSLQCARLTPRSSCLHPPEEFKKSAS